MTFISNDFAILATSEPMLPQPTKPIVLDFNSIPLKSSFSHFFLNW
jgi:hypothetical protein